MKNFLAFMMLAIIPSIGVMSCISPEGGEPGVYITTSENIKEEFSENVVPVPIEDIPEDVQQNLSLEEGETFVFSDKSSMIDPTESVTIIAADEGGDSDWVDNALNTAFYVGSAFIPGLAAWEGVFTLFSKRKKKWYGNAVQAATPGSKTPAKELLPSLVKALGVSHSSKDTEKLAHDKEGKHYVGDNTAMKAEVSTLNG